jgi:hypothetical protein
LATLPGVPEEMPPEAQLEAELAMRLPEALAAMRLQAARPTPEPWLCLPERL